MFAQLGSIPFQGLKGFTQFNESRSTNLAEHSRIEGKPRLQRVGSNLHELSVTVQLHASFCNPEEDFANLDDARETSEILPLILSNGVYVADYVIASIERNVQQTDAQSNIISMTLSMTLKEAYNPSPQQTLATTAKQNAYATSDGGAKPLRILRPLPPTDAQSSVNDISGMRLEAKSIDLQVNRAEVVPEERAFISGKLLGSLTRIDQSSQRVQQRIVDPSIIPYAGTLPTSLVALSSSVNNMIAILPITNINDLKQFNSALQNAVNNVTASSSILKNAVITRKI